VGVDVAGADRCIDELGELGCAGLGDHGRAAGAVGGNGAVVASQVGALHVAQARSSVAGARAADGDEAEAFDGAGDEFAVEAAADEDVEAVFAKAPGAGEQAAMPEGVDGGGWDVVTGSRSGFAYVAVTEGDAETADGHAREAGDDGEDYPLLQAVRMGHWMSLPLRWGGGASWR